MSKKLKKISYRFERNKLKEVDKSLYCLLQTAYDLKLITEKAFHHATTSETNLLIPIEDV